MVGAIYKLGAGCLYFFPAPLARRPEMACYMEEGDDPGVTSLAAPNAALSRVVRYSLMARLDMERQLAAVERSVSPGGEGSAQ